MAHVSGQHGSLLLDGTEVAKVRDWSINLQHQPLDTTTLGDTDRVKTHGLRSYSGSGTLLYYQENNSNLARITGDTFHEASGTPSNKTFGRTADEPNAPVKLDLRVTGTSQTLLFSMPTSQA